MSRRKAQPDSLLLGPDGKPLDKAKYAPKPVDKVTHEYTLTIDDTDFTPAVKAFELSTFPFWGGISTNAGARKTKAKASLADRVTADVNELTADFDGHGGAELPTRPLDITEYHDALEYAMRNCKHTNVESTMYAKGEYQCSDCGHYLSRDEMRKRQSGGIFGSWFQ